MQKWLQNESNGVKVEFKLIQPLLFRKWTLANPKSMCMIQVCYPFIILNQYQCNVHENKIQVLELVPMDLLDKVEEIVMTSLSILYNINLVPLAICALTLAAYLEQQRSVVKEEL